MKSYLYIYTYIYPCTYQLWEGTEKAKIAKSVPSKCDMNPTSIKKKEWLTCKGRDAWGRENANVIKIFQNSTR